MINFLYLLQATCEFGRLDNPELTSGGEHIILNPNGGGVSFINYN